MHHNPPNLITGIDITGHLTEQSIHMIEPLGRIDQTDMMVTTGQERIQEQRINIALETPGIKLH